MGVYVAGDSPAMDRIVADAVAGIGADIAALRVPRLLGVVLGGGYGRGEGGVLVSEDGVESLSNDLDFYVVAEDGSTGAQLAAIGESLRPVALKWHDALGIDVDFCPAKTQWRIRHDQERVMIQELVHGYFDVAGAKGDVLFSGVERRAPETFPWMEAARLLMNRGVGLMLAMESRDAGFVVRNVNKCVLGAGDARLIARHGYKWRALDRAAALDDRLYSAAVEWKFRPRREGVCDWETARRAWLDAEEETMAAGRRAGAMRRSVYQAARWVARRRTAGELRSFGQDCVVRVLRSLSRGVRERRPLSASLRKDWMIFN